MQLPRVTYTNYNVDFSPLHDYLDRLIPEFKRDYLGKTYPNIIDGLESKTGDLYKLSSPISSEITLGSFYSANKQVVSDAITSAKNTYKTWSGLNWRERVMIMQRVAHELDKYKYILGLAALYEVGKSRLEAIGETEEAADFVKYYCDEMEKNNGYSGNTSRAYPNEDAKYILKPYGVFAVISPFNFPVAMAVNMITGAILTGNTCVFKPSPNSALTASILVDVLHKAGLPKGVVNLVCGGDETGKALSDSPDIDGIVFTGSYKVGMELCKKMTSGNYIKPCIVEMGGKNPSYVTAKADIEAAAYGVMRSSMGMCGQKCSANSRVYVEKSIAASFKERLISLISQIKIGNPENKDIYLGPVIDDNAVSRYKKVADEARKDGNIIFGGNVIKDKYVEPMVIEKLEWSHRLNRDELFLPILSILEYDNLEDAIKDGNSVNYGLTAGFYSLDSKEVETFTNLAEAGVLYINRASGATTGTWPGTQTFTGWKGSGGSGKGGMGPFYLPQFMREQSQTRWFGLML